MEHEHEWVEATVIGDEAKRELCACGAQRITRDGRSLISEAKYGLPAGFYWTGEGWRGEEEMREWFEPLAATGPTQRLSPTCRECGKELPAGAAFCIFCAVPREQA